MVHIQATKDQTKEALVQRLLKTPSRSMRPDDLGGEHVFERRWAEYSNHTVAALQSLNGSVIPVSRGVPLQQRVDIVLNRLEEHHQPPADRESVLLARRLLGDHRHHVNRLISEIERPVSTNTRHPFAQMVSAS